MKNSKTNTFKINNNFENKSYLLYHLSKYLIFKFKVLFTYNKILYRIFYSQFIQIYFRKYLKYSKTKQLKKSYLPSVYAKLKRCTEICPSLNGVHSKYSSKTGNKRQRERDKERGSVKETVSDPRATQSRLCHKRFTQNVYT